eukprot:2685656-Prymnesium_polylepis.2
MSSSSPSRAHGRTRDECDHWSSSGVTEESRASSLMPSRRASQTGSFNRSSCSPSRRVSHSSPGPAGEVAGA